MIGISDLQHVGCRVVSLNDRHSCIGAKRDGDWFDARFVGHSENVPTRGDKSIGHDMLGAGKLALDGGNRGAGTFEMFLHRAQCGWRGISFFVRG